MAMLSTLPSQVKTNDWTFHTTLDGAANEYIGSVMDAAIYALIHRPALYVQPVHPMIHLPAGRTQFQLVQAKET
eukprot:8917895-Ditylum_brightwellii.AAC.1